MTEAVHFISDNMLLYRGNIRMKNLISSVTTSSIFHDAYMGLEPLAFCYRERVCTSEYEIPEKRSAEYVARCTLQSLPRSRHGEGSGCKCVIQHEVNKPSCSTRSLRRSSSISAFERVVLNGRRNSEVSAPKNASLLFYSLGYCSFKFSVGLLAFQSNYGKSPS